MVGRQEGHPADRSTSTRTCKSLLLGTGLTWNNSGKKGRLKKNCARACVCGNIWRVRCDVTVFMMCSSSAEGCQSCELSRSQAELHTHKNTVNVVSAIFGAATQLLGQAQACCGLLSIDFSACTVQQIWLTWSRFVQIVVNFKLRCTVCIIWSRTCSSLLKTTRLLRLLSDARLNISTSHFTSTPSTFQVILQLMHNINYLLTYLLTYKILAGCFIL